MSGISKSEALKLLRSLYRQLRTNTTSDFSSKPISQTETWKHIVERSRLQDKDGSSLVNYNLGKTYLQYLQSSYRHLSMVTTYKGKGERSTRETADLMGFKLPHDVPVPRKKKN